MRRLILILLTCLASASHAAPADDIATRLGTRLEQAPVIRAQFEQKKDMAAFKKPLITRGRLVFARQHGVLWQIEQPLKLTYVLQEGRMVEIGDDGAVQTRTTQDAPAVAQIGRIFRALLGGQTKALAEFFDSTGSGDPDKAWILTLNPRNPQVGQFIKHITLTGGKHVDNLRIEEANGDTATIRFRQTIEASELSAEERKLFGK